MQTMVHVSQFISWSEAVASGNEKMADFMEGTFHPVLKKAVDEWRAMKPLQNTSAPKHPFALPVYRLDEEDKADSVQVLYDAEYVKAMDQNAHSEHYTLLTVILASVLFFGGITSNITDVRTKTFLVIGSSLLLVGSVIWLLTFPMILR